MLSKLTINVKKGRKGHASGEIEVCFFHPAIYIYISNDYSLDGIKFIIVLEC